MELIRLLSAKNIACTFWKEWLLSSWIHILFISTSLIILHCDGVPLVNVFETQKGVLDSVQKGILYSHSEQMHCPYAFVYMQSWLWQQE